MGKRYPCLVVVGGADAHGDVRHHGVTAVVGVGAGRGQRDAIGLRAVVHVVVCAGDGNRLGGIPVTGRERQGARTCHALVGGATGHRDRDVGGRFAVQFDGEARSTTRLCRLAGYGAGGDARRIGVVGGADAHGFAQAVIVAVAGAGRGKRDVIGLRAVVDGVVLTGDGDGLIIIPVARRERQRARTRRALVGGAAGHRHGDVGGRRGVELDREAGGAAGLRCLAGYGSCRQARRVIVLGSDAHLGVGQVVIGGVAAGRIQDDLVGLIAVVRGVVHTGDGHRLGVIPVAGRERQAARTRRALGGGVTGHADEDAVGRFAVQFDGERVGSAIAAGLGHGGRTAALDDRQARRVVIGGDGAHGYVRHGGVTAVVGVGAGRGKVDVVVHIAVVDVVVNAGDGNRLGAVPVARRERQRARTDAALVGGAAGHRDRDVVGRFAVQFDGEGVGSAIAGGLGHAGRTVAVGGRQARIVVIGGGDAHVHVRHHGVAAVVGVAAGRGQRNVVGLIAVVHVVVLAGDRHRLGVIPVAGGERQAARVDRALVGGVTGHRHGDVGGRLAAQFDGKGVGGAGLAHAGGAAADMGGRQSRRVIFGNGDRYRIGRINKAAGYHPAGLGDRADRQRTTPRTTIDHVVIDRAYPICKYSVSVMAASVHKYTTGAEANVLPDGGVNDRANARVAARKGANRVKPRVTLRVVRQFHPNVGNAAFRKPARKKRQDKAALVVDDRQGYVARRRYQTGAGAADSRRYRYTLV